MFKSHSGPKSILVSCSLFLTISEKWEQLSYASFDTETGDSKGRQVLFSKFIAMHNTSFHVSLRIMTLPMHFIIFVEKSCVLVYFK